MRLCEICDSANSSAFEEGECHICKGNAMKTEQMVSEASALLDKEGVKSFSISTIIPKDWLIREEDVWDRKAGDSESIKNLLNRRISAALRKASGAEYSSDGECRMVFDYSKASVELQRNELFVFGRYRKLAAGLSQSRWKCTKCDGKGCAQCGGKGKYYDSVEERIGEPFKKATEAQDYVMHASGREDVDATNSAGRGFVLEIKNPKNRKIDHASLAKEIATSKEVEVSDLRIVPRGFVEVVTESHFDKTYRAEVEFGRKIGAEDVAKMMSLEGKMILQQTPARVAHRRADLVRHRKVKKLEAADVRENNATLTIKAEAGTYIKELISGDNGRTNPSIAGLLGTTATCRKLDVNSIGDGFLDFCLSARRE
ncbi:MAG: tRNA pseudouridine(54/55) synthase Pus10 [Candidatus ainarchaeum sp.]|nr:tRNA pseudouridine(54/55) synthase Pus10 [Candidatus ainarchaeum sp.]